MDVNVNVHWTFHRRYHITDDQPTTFYQDHYHLYMVTKYGFARDSFLVKMVFPCLHFKATLLNFCALTNGATLSKYFLIF